MAASTTPYARGYLPSSHYFVSRNLPIGIIRSHSYHFPQKKISKIQLKLLKFLVYFCSVRVQYIFSVCNDSTQNPYSKIVKSYNMKLDILWILLYRTYKLI